MGGGSEQSTRFEPPSWTEGRYPLAMEELDDLVQTPFAKYAGMRIAPINEWQHGAGQLTVDRALYGDPQLNASRATLMNIAGGGAANPFADNAYTEQMIGDTAGNMSDAYARGTAATNDALAAMNGAFGGGLHQQKSALDAAELAKQVGQMGTSTRQSEIGRKAGLWSGDVDRAMQASSMAPQFSMLDQEAFDAMNRYGTQQRDYSQSLLSDRYGEWQREQEHPFRMLQMYLNGLGQGSGQYGVNSSTGPAASPWATAGGLGAGLYGLSQMRF